MRSVVLLFLVLLVGPPAVAVDLPDQTSAFRDHRAIWISRFEFSTESSIRSRIQAIADAGFTDVVFQVRGQGDVLFDSAIETWDQNKYPANGPGFDPLAVAVQEAHAGGLRLHAWMNAIPMWRDTSSPYNPPISPDHFYNDRPDLRLKDSNGNDMPLSSGQYVGVNPTHPDTVAHLSALAAEIVNNYDVDGVHLDYIRMVTNSFNTPLAYPQDADTRSRFFNETGLNATTSPNQYKQWVGDKITTLVESVRDTIATNDPSAELSAAVWRDYDIGTNDYQQHADDWVENASLNTAMPMIYTTNDALFRDNLLKWKSLDADAAVFSGLGSYLHPNADQTIRQLDTAQYLGANGFTLFSYGTLFSGTTLNSFGQAVKAYNEELAGRDDDLLPLGSFEDGEGYFAYAPGVSGSNIGIGAGSTTDATTEEAYDGIQSQKLFIDGDAGGWFLRHLAGTGGDIANPDGNQELIADGYLGFWLKTTDPGLTVRLAIDDVEGTAERGTLYDVIADGDWHLYQWNLDDDADWEGWVNGNGQINGQTVTLDSIQFFGSGDATVYLDKVAFNPFGSLAAAILGDYNNDGAVDQADLDLVLLNWGDDTAVTGVPSGWINEQPTGLIGQTELDGVLLSWGNSAEAGGTAVPEPAAAVLFGLAGLTLRRSRGNA